MVSDKTVEIQVWSGASGPCIYINNYRICGPKPWGGKPTYTWDADLKDLLAHLPKAHSEELAEVREILAHTDIGSLPNDWTAKMVAEARIDDLLKLRDQVRDTCVRAEKAEAELARLQQTLP